MNATPQLGAHEVIGMNEALMTKAANAEFFSFLAQQVQDQRLQQIFENQAQHIHAHYMQGVNLLQSQGAQGASQSMGAQMPGMMGGMNAQGMNTQGMNTQGMNAQGMMTNTMMSTQPKLGLRQPSMPQPNMQGQAISERAACTIALNIHKFGAVAWTTLALECTNPQLRTYLMNGAQVCDQMAYEIWSFMNQKGYYQVPTLLEKTTQTMIQAYQAPQSGATMQQPIHGMNNFQ